MFGTSNLSQTIAIDAVYCRTLDGIFHKLFQAKLFTKANFSKGFYHIELDEASSLLTTFNTHTWNV